MKGANERFSKLVTLSKIRYEMLALNLLYPGEMLINILISFDNGINWNSDIRNFPFHSPTLFSISYIINMILLDNKIILRISI